MHTINIQSKRSTSGSNLFISIITFRVIIDDQEFQVKIHKLRLKLHIKHTKKKQTNTSHEIKVTSCPFTTTELKHFSRRISLEEMMDKVRFVLKSDQFDARCKDIEFDEDR